MGRQQCLHHKHVDLSSNPWQSCKKARQVHVPVTLVLEWTGRNRQIQGVYWVNQSSQNGRPLVQWETLSQGNEAKSSRRNLHIMCRYHIHPTHTIHAFNTHLTHHTPAHNYTHAHTFIMSFRYFFMFQLG